MIYVYGNDTRLEFDTEHVTGHIAMESKPPVYILHGDLVILCC